MLEEENNKRNRKRQTSLLTLSGIFLVIGLLWFFHWLVWGRFEIGTDDAYVNGNMVQLMSQTPGTVTEINADDTQFVTQGQVIIKFDPADTDLALQHAQAALSEAVRQVRQMFEDAQRAEATVAARKADLVKAQLDVKRRTALVGNSAVSREEYQHFLTALDTAQAQYDIAMHNLLSAEALVTNTHIYTHPLVERAKADFVTAYLNTQRTTILAPVTGYIAKRSVQVGQHVLENTPMLAIIPLRGVWVDANYKESQLKDLRIGQPVTLQADAYPNITYHGKVFGLSPGTGAAFALLPPQNATGNWIKIVQRLPVRIWLNPEELKQHPLQLGLSMRVVIHIHDTSGPMLATAAPTKPIYTTDVYAQQTKDANQIMNQILQENSPDMFFPGETHE